MSIDRDGDGPPLRRPDSKVSLTPGEGRSSDLRATPFTDDVFNDDYYGRRPSRGEGGTSISVIAGVILGLAVAGGAGWYFLRDGGGLTFTPGAVGFIKADPTPYKVRPDEPGGMQVENQDKLVYDRVAKGDAPARVENLLPPAEEPKAPPMKPAPEVAAPPQAEAAKADPAKPEPAPPAPEVAKAAEDPKPDAKPDAAKPADPAPAAAPQADPLAAAVAAATGGRTSATGPIDVVPTAETPVEPQTAAVPPTTVVPPGGPTFQVQLASVLSEEAALAEWKRISGKNKDLLGAYSPAVTKADLGERGVFYRLRAGPLADKAAADALCASLGAANVGCIVVRP